MSEFQTEVFPQDLASVFCFLVFLRQMTNGILMLGNLFFLEPEVADVNLCEIVGNPLFHLLVLVKK